MNNKFTKIGLISLLIVLVMSVGAVAAFAQEDVTPDADAQPALPFGHGGFGGPRGHHGQGGADEEALAEALGVTVEELQAAREQAQAERIAQAVEDGYLTQEQADNMLAMQALRAYIDKEAILAQVLGLTTEEFEAAHEDGTLRDLLANITPADLQARMQEATDAAIARAVAEGAISQEQADLLAEQIQGGLGMAEGFGGHRGFGGGHGGFRGVPQTDQTGTTFAPFGA